MQEIYIAIDYRVNVMSQDADRGGATAVIIDLLSFEEVQFRNFANEAVFFRTRQVIPSVSFFQKLDTILPIQPIVGILR